VAIPGDNLASIAQTNLASAERWSLIAAENRCRPRPSRDSAAAKVIATSALADERVFRLVFWWLRRPRMQAEMVTYLRRGLVWTDDETEVAAILQLPKSDRTGPQTRHRQMLSAYASLAAVSVAAMTPAVLAGLAVLLGLLFALNYVAPVAALLGILLVIAGVARGFWRLEKSKPKDAYFFSNFARAPQARPGKGSLFLTALTDQADHLSWTVALHTAHPRLVTYYEHHGFTVVRSVRMPWRETIHLMVRRPKDGGTP